MSYQHSHFQPASQRWAKRYSIIRCAILMVGWYAGRAKHLRSHVVIQLHAHRKQVLQPTHLWGRQGLSQSSELYNIYIYILGQALLNNKVRYIDGRLVRWTRETSPFARSYSITCTSETGSPTNSLMGKARIEPEFGTL